MRWDITSGKRQFLEKNSSGIKLSEIFLSHFSTGRAELFPCHGLVCPRFSRIIGGPFLVAKAKVLVMLKGWYCFSATRNPGLFGRVMISYRDELFNERYLIKYTAEWRGQDYFCSSRLTFFRIDKNAALVIKRIKIRLKCVHYKVVSSCKVIPRYK